MPFWKREEKESLSNQIDIEAARIEAERMAKEIRRAAKNLIQISEKLESEVEYGRAADGRQAERS